MSTAATPAADAPTAFLAPPSWTQPLDLATCFNTPQPLDLDLGCGKGRFLLAHAAAHPERNVLGVDRLLIRMRRVDARIQKRGLANVRLLRVENAYAARFLLPAGAVSTCYIFFPDPWPKRRHHRRRLFTPAFVADLHRILRPAGEVHVATDHAEYGAAIRGGFAAADTGFEPIPPYVPPPEARTDFECHFVAQALPIHRCAYRKRA